MAMRLSRRLFASAAAGAPEFVPTLLRTGRVADLGMLNHFTDAVQAEQEAAAIAQKPVATTGVSGSEGLCELPLHQPSQWVGDVFGSSEWYVSPEAPGSLTVKRQNGNLLVTGQASAVGSNANKKPSSIAAVVRLDDGGSTSVGQYRIKVNDGASCKATLQRSNLHCLVDLSNHPCEEIQLPQLAEGESLVDVANKKLCDVRIAYCQNVSKTVRSLQHVCALHATSAVRYDALVLRDQQAQKVIAQLQCTGFAIDALASYAAGTQNPSDIAMARIYAANALESAVQAAKGLVGPMIYFADGPHRSNPSVRIPYGYVKTIAEIAPDLLHLDGSRSDVAGFVVAEVLRSSGALQRFGGSTSGSPLDSLFNRNSNAVRLTSPHLNLSITARTIEKDIASFLQTIAQRIKKAKGVADLVVVDATASFLSEIFASTVAVYRCTAALTVDEDVSGQREWLWTQGLCDLSRARRASIVQRLAMDEGSAKSLWQSTIAQKEYDEFAVHPVEAGMMKAAKKKVATTTASSAKAATAAAAAK